MALDRVGAEPIMVTMEQTTFSLTEAKPSIGRMVRRALNGEEIIITNHGTPAVVLVPVARMANLEAVWRRLEDHRPEDDEFRQRMQDERNRRLEREAVDLFQARR